MGQARPFGWCCQTTGCRSCSLRSGILLALLFVTLPFVIRTVQPVLLASSTIGEEEAAFSLGRQRLDTSSEGRPAGSTPGDHCRRAAGLRPRVGEFGSS